jgi:hypothetical protein
MRCEDLRSREADGIGLQRERGPRETGGFSYIQRYFPFVQHAEGVERPGTGGVVQ